MDDVQKGRTVADGGTPEEQAPQERPASERTTSERHIPVLLERCVELLAPALSAPGAVLVDATLGMGGHAEAFLQRFDDLTLVGIDRDPQAISLASERLAPFGERFRAVHATYDQIHDIAAEFGARDGAGRPGTVQGVLMDLGVSSLQLDETERGFSYAQDAPLDMRMDSTAGLTAAELIATASEAELTRILRRYGEEKFAPRIARELVARRATDPVTRTGQLVEVVRGALPAAAKRTGGNPAKRTFQALRIAVNGELEVLERALPRAIEALAVGGRIAIESYQSLEDRIVKQEFRRAATVDAPPGLPIVPEEAQPYLELLTRGAELADEAEQIHNPRSASVRLRAAKRLRPTPARRRML